MVVVVVFWHIVGVLVWGMGVLGGAGGEEGRWVKRHLVRFQLVK